MYIFNKRRTSIKILCYDRNGFILPQKKLLDFNQMNFKWNRNKCELKSISKEQLNWLLSGLEIFIKKYFEDIKINKENIAI